MIFGSSSILVVKSLSLYFQIDNYPFLLALIRKNGHQLSWKNERRKLTTKFDEEPLIFQFHFSYSHKI